jgi:hypothetical protein
LTKKRGWTYLGDLFYFASLQALGADPDSLMGTVYIDVHPLQIGIPSPSSFVIGMADPIPYQNTFAANITPISHKKILH